MTAVTERGSFHDNPPCVPLNPRSRPARLEAEWMTAVTNRRSFHDNHPCITLNPLSCPGDDPLDSRREDQTASRGSAIGLLASADHVEPASPAQALASSRHRRGRGPADRV